MVAFEERVCGKEDVKSETRKGVFGGKKRYFGVEKRGKRWLARVRNPLLKARVSLGSYRTREEAALIVKKKLAEFEEMFKGQKSSSMETCRGYFEGKKLPGGWGVRRQIGRNRLHIRHLKLQNWISGGSCAAIVADKDKVEFQETYGGKVGELRFLSGDANVPPGLMRIKSGKWVARIRKPGSKDRIWLGTYNTLEEAISSYNKKKAEFDAKQEKLEFDCAESRCDSEASVSAHKEGGEDETSDGDSGVKKRFLGVDKHGNRWRARARNPLLRATVHLGYYETPEEAARVAKKKRAEFEEMFKGLDCSSTGKKLRRGVRKKKRKRNRDECEETYGGKVRKLRVMSVDANVPPGVFRIQSGKWVARIRKPESKDRIWLGTYNTLEEAISSFNKKKAEFDASVSQMKSEFSSGSAEFSSGSETSVSQMKSGNELGYDGPTSLLSAHKEGEEVETCDGDSGVKKRFLGVCKVRNRWRARVTNPMLRTEVHLGYYGTPEEAALVVKKKKAEFEELFKGQESSSMGTCRDYLEGKKLPGSWGVRRNRVHIRHPKSRNWVSGGSYATVVADKKREEFQEMYRGNVGKVIVMSGDAISSFNKKKPGFNAKQKKSEIDSAEFRSCSEASESPMKFGNELGYDRLTSVLSVHNLNNVALDDNSTIDSEVVDIPGRLGDGLVHGSPISALDPKNISTASVGDKTFDSEFDRALSLGIIDEYGQLLGKYSEVDTQMLFRPTLENVTDSTETLVISPYW